MTPPAPFAAEEASVSRQLRRLSTVSIALAPLALLAVRILIISDFDSGTSRAVLTSSRQPDVFVALLIDFLPALVAYLAVTLYILVKSLSFSDPVTAISATAGSAILVAAAIILNPPLLVLLIAGSAWAVLFPYRRAEKRGQEVSAPQRRLAIGRWVALTSVLTIGSQLLVLPSSWLAREQLILDSAGTAETITAYVLNEEGPFVDVLEVEPREVLRLPAESVTARSLCVSDAPVFFRTTGRLVRDLVKRLASRQTPTAYVDCRS